MKFISMMTVFLAFGSYALADQAPLVVCTGIDPVTKNQETVSVIKVRKRPLNLGLQISISGEATVTIAIQKLDTTSMADRITAYAGPILLTYVTGTHATGVINAGGAKEVILKCNSGSNQDLAAAKQI